MSFSRLVRFPKAAALIVRTFAACVEQSDDAEHRVAASGQRAHLVGCSDAALCKWRGSRKRQRRTHRLSGRRCRRQRSRPGQSLLSPITSRSKKHWATAGNCLFTSPHRTSDCINADHVPIGGKYPVSMWKDGEIIRDVQKIPLPQNFTNDKMAMFVGFYKKNERLAVKSGRQDGKTASSRWSFRSKAAPSFRLSTSCKSGILAPASPSW